MAKNTLRLFHRGAQFELYELVINGRSPVEEYIDGLGQAEQQKILALLKRRRPRSAEKYRKIQEIA